MELTTQVFLELEIRREWTEYKDAKKALIFKDWGAAVASLKDVLKFQIRNALDLSHIQLLDPVIWWYAEEGNLPISLRKALEYIYNSEEDFFQTPLKRRKETLPRR